MKPLANLLLLLLALIACAQTNQRRFGPLLDPEMLRNSGARKLLGLTAEQDRKIVALWSKWAETPLALGSDPKANRKSVEAHQKLRFDAIDKSMALLTPAQKARLREFSIQLASPMGLDHPEIAKLIGLSDEQKKKIRAASLVLLHRAMDRQTTEAAKKKVLDEAWAVLTPAQKKKLRAMSGKPADLNAIRKGTIIGAKGPPIKRV